MEKKKTHIDIGTIGHVDHGKTSLTDAINKSLAQRGMCDIINDNDYGITINETYLKKRESSKIKKKKRR